MRKCVIAAALLAALGLGGCGSNGSSGSGSSSEVDNVSQYLGTWKTACYVTDVTGTVNGSPTENARSIDTYVLTKDSNSQLRFSLQRNFYLGTDGKCEGSVIANVTYQGVNARTYTEETTSGGVKTIVSALGDNTMKYMGTGTSTIGGASVTVGKFLISTAPLAFGVDSDSKKLAELSGYIYVAPIGSSTLAGRQNVGQTLYISIAKATDNTQTTQLIFGNTEAFDANGYPTYLLPRDSSGAWIKQ